MIEYMACTRVATTISQQVQHHLDIIAGATLFHGRDRRVEAEAGRGRPGVRRAAAADAAYRGNAAATVDLDAASQRES